MSNVPDTNIDLESLFLPAWAQQSPSVNQFANFEGESEGAGDRRRPRGRDQRPPGRRDRDRGPRPGPSGPYPPAGGREPAGQFRGPRPQHGGAPRGQFREERREAPPQPLPQIEVTIIPEERGVESLARQIKLTGRAYPLFDIAHLIIKKPERYTVQLNVVKNAEGQVAQPIILCSMDETLWLSEDEAMSHILDRHFGTFYQSEKIAGEPPKGVFTFVAQCGMSGVILGPPNLHDYQNKLHKLHSERFQNMPFEVFKSRIKIVKDEATVKKWVEEQSFKTEYVCLNVPEPLRLSNRADVEQHFRATHLPNVIQSLETYILSGTAARSLPYGPFASLYRRNFEEQRRFPIRVVTALSQSFASLGLQFFKVNKSVTHVAVSRPHFLDLNLTAVSEGVKNIINLINSHPGSTRRHVMEHLAPAPPVPVVAPPPPEAAPVSAEPAPAATEAQASAPPPAPSAPAPTPEQSAVISDLHWLIHQGHVIEFANGVLETAKAPAPRPPRPAPRPMAATRAVQAAQPAPEGLAEAGAPVETGEVSGAVPAPQVEVAQPEGLPAIPPPEAAPAAVVESAPVIPVESQPDHQQAQT